MKAVFAFLLVVETAARNGTETQCIGDQAHTVTYDIQGGDTLESITDAKISVRPEPAMNGYCAGPSGDKAVCVGANTDDCASATADLPINEVLDCQSCFAGATTDLFYDLDVSMLRLKKVEVGLRNTHIRGALEARAHAEASAPIASGSIAIVDASKSLKISFKVANIIPVDLTIAMPTDLDYSLDVQADVDATAGADVDINLGDHFISWEKSTGWVVHNTSASVDVTPVMSLNSAEAVASLGLSLRSSLQVDLDKVMWYHVNMSPSLPTKLSADAVAKQVCLDGDVDFEVNHEADLHFTLFGKDHDIYHFGPQDLFHYHKDKALHKCIDLPSIIV